MPILIRNHDQNQTVLWLDSLVSHWLCLQRYSEGIYMALVVNLEYYADHYKQC